MKDKKIGIITFHNSYNCGSMLESFAIQKIIEKLGGNPEIINFSNSGQRRLYSVFFKNNSIKNIIKNILILPGINKIKYNNKMYEKFKNTNFVLSDEYSNMSQLSDENYNVVVAGSDQIWNITISDSDDAYFLPWVSNAKKVAYAPSFGAKNILKNSSCPEKYKKMLLDFDSLSIRENNGKKWIKDLCNKNVDVLLDPTLLLEREDYDRIADKNYRVNGNYIFFYSPAFNRDICRFVKKISEKYNLKVITWSTKSYYMKFIKTFGFELPDYEDPSIYLNLIKNADIVITTSYHGTIFSTIYRKKFIVAKNGGMYGDDDRVKTLLEQLNMNDRLMPYTFDETYNYLSSVDYSEYDSNLPKLKKKSIDYINKEIINND